jgi:hypothetical protein
MGGIYRAVAMEIWFCTAVSNGWAMQKCIYGSLRKSSRQLEDLFVTWVSFVSLNSFYSSIPIYQIRWCCTTPSPLIHWRGLPAGREEPAGGGAQISSPQPLRVRSQPPARRGGGEAVGRSIRTSTSPCAAHKGATWATDRERGGTRGH